MREQLQRFGPWGVAAVLIYTAWSGVSGDAPPKKDERSKIAELPAACLARRGAAEKLAALRDPFQSEWAPYGPQYAPEYIADQRQKKDDAEHEATRIANEESMARKRAAIAVVARHDREAPTSFTLVLDAIARSEDGSTARICGRTVRVGDAIPGLGVEPAPTLVAVDGTSANVEWKGRVFVVRLDGGPVIVEPPREAPADSGAAAPAPRKEPETPAIRTEPAR